MTCGDAEGDHDDHGDEDGDDHDDMITLMMIT